MLLNSRASGSVCASRFFRWSSAQARRLAYMGQWLMRPTKLRISSQRAMTLPTARPRGALRPGPLCEAGASGVAGADGRCFGGGGGGWGGAGGARGGQEGVGSLGAGGRGHEGAGAAMLAGAAVAAATLAGSSSPGQPTPGAGHSGTHPATSGGRHSCDLAPARRHDPQHRPWRCCARGVCGRERTYICMRLGSTPAAPFPSPYDVTNMQA